jgi:hypothetical protein
VARLWVLDSHTLPIRPGFLCPLADQTHELHGTGVEGASLDQLQIFSELLEKHHLVIALCVSRRVLRIHENETKTGDYRKTYADKDKL